MPSKMNETKAQIEARQKKARKARVAERRKGKVVKKAKKRSRSDFRGINPKNNIEPLSDEWYAQNEISNKHLQARHTRARDRRKNRKRLKKKGKRVIDPNLRLLEAGYQWAEETLDIKFKIPASKPREQKIVVNGNIALGLGIMASGMQ